MLQFLPFRGTQLGQGWSHGSGPGAGAEDDAGYEQDTWLLSREMGSTQRGWIGGNLGGTWKRAFRSGQNLWWQLVVEYRLHLEGDVASASDEVWESKRWTKVSQRQSQEGKTRGELSSCFHVEKNLSIIRWRRANERWSLGWNDFLFFEAPWLQ